MKVLLLGAGGKVGRALAPRLAAAGHDVTPAGRDTAWTPEGHDALVDFTRPDAVRGNVERCLAAGVACVVGTTGLEEDDLADLDALARERGIACLIAPNFAVGAVLMMRLAAEAAAVLPRVEIVELHNEAKLDAPSGTAKATAAALPGEPPIHSVRLPGLVAHQEVLLGGEGQLLTIRHDAFSREAFAPGVLLALERLPDLPPGLTLGLDAIL
ncbi:MAG TPA: dihydrodipicolinate reductase C-terminal domain-containing protein [Gaiellaceae bacterium]|nr:dihydrodipicolinate reductase C-terminal domain-containing protein [Gaiellaceae bacterium]